MADFASIADEVFKVLQSFDYTVLLYNDEGMRVAEPEEARRMFDRHHNLMVSLVDEDDDSRVTLQIGKHTHAADVMGLIQSLRATSTKYNMTFRVQNFNKDIDPKQISQLASISEAHKDTANMEVLEGMYGTSRSSYLRLENARMIVRHKARIDDSKKGARSRCVETILIENGVGERYRFPTANLSAGRAMTQHVNQGGGFTDPVGQQITSMAEDYSHLAEAVRSVKRLNEEGMTFPTSDSTTPTVSTASTSSTTIPSSGSMPASSASDIEVPESRMVREACQCKMHKLKKTFENLYRPSSYATEAADVAARANLLTESDSKIDEARLAELRQLLNDDDLDEKVYECAAKAMDEVKEAAIDAEGGTVSVFDYRVDKGAWEEFRRGKLRLSSHPVFDKHTFKSAIAELVYRLGQIVPVVADDSMANLLSYVADELPGSENKRQLALIGLQALKSARKQAVQPEVQEAPVAPMGASIGVLDHQISAGVWNELKHGKIGLSGQPVFDKHPFKSAVAELIYRLGQIVPKVKDDSLANLLAFVADRLPDVESQEERKKYAQVGMMALKAARQTPDEHALADKNDVIQEMYRWFAQFTTDKALVEGFDPSNTMNPYHPAHETYDDGLDSTVQNFDPWAFLENGDAGGELIHNLDPKNPNENVVDKNELMDYLVSYLRDEAETFTGAYVDDEQTIENMAHLVYDKTVEALQERGFIVKDGGDLTEGPLDEAEELTREDILLPPKNMGDDLSGEVSKATVHDPDTGQERKPTSNYVARLKTLAGMNTGQNTTGY